MLTADQWCSLPTKLNRLFRLYSVRRNTPSANPSPGRDLDKAMSRPNLELVETARDRITIVADFPHLSPALLFDYWTSIDLLKKWWPPAAELQPKVGGTYHFSWPKQDWASSGQVHDVRQREDTRLHVEVGP